MTIRLTIGGRHHEGWTEALVRRSIETISGAFQLGVSERDPGALTPRAITPGEECTIALDGETVITGYVDAVEIRYDAETHVIKVKGRDRTGDLVDCSAVQQEWANAKLEAIAMEIAAPFGVTVRTVEDTGEVFRKFTIERGETAFEAIDRLCRLRGLLPISDGKGGIVIGRAARERVGTRLMRGVNILKANGRADWSERHSAYTILGQQAGSDEVFGGEARNVTQVSAEAEDPGVTRYRPLVVLAEQGLSPAEAQERVKWEAAVRRGRSRQIMVTVQGWREGGGALWAPGGLVSVMDDWLGIERNLLISTVDQGISDAGTISTLTLMPEDAFLQEPRQADNSGGGQGGTGGGYWE